MKLPVPIAAVALILPVVACGGGPSDAERHNDRGLDLLQEERYRAAIQEYDKAIEQDANMASAYVNRGQAYNLMGDRPRAIADLDKAIEIDPNLELAYFYRGNAYESLRDSGQAIADYKKALALTGDPYFAAVVSARIELLERLDGQ